MTTTLQKPVQVGFAFTGSFCTFSQVISQLEAVAQHPNWEVIPIMSPNAYSIDTRFGLAKDFRAQIQKICNHEIIHTIFDAEPIGHKNSDVLIAAMHETPWKACKAFMIQCHLAVKAHLRNARPVVIAVSTNDALASSAKNIGTLFNNRHIFFVPMAQDNAQSKPTSIVADFTKLIPSIESALEEKQLQPVLLG